MSSTHNLKNVVLQFKLLKADNNLFKYSMSLRKFNLAELLEMRKLALEKLFRNSFRQEPSKLLKVWARQCECVLAQRVRRGQQMFSLYSKLWEEHALRELIKNMRKQLTRNGKECLFSAIGVVCYNWERNRISDDEIRSHMNEIEYIQLLRDKTVKCQVCNQEPEISDKNIMAFCDCKGRKASLDTFENWSLFIQQNDLIVWRRLHQSGSYEYKVYGSYNDVTAEDFLSVQIDTTYRKEWDPTAIALEVIETDCIPSNSDLVYWEMQWPRLFSNRDYVFNRRFLVDPAQRTVMLLSKGTEHPDYPAKSNKFRVSDYWSSMVIKPYTEINKPGIEFSLTYYDNPGVNIPASVTAWVAYRAMPDFLTRLRDATKKYKQYCRDHNCNSIYSYNDRTVSEINLTLDEDENILDILLGNSNRMNDQMAPDFISNDHGKQVVRERVEPQLPSSTPGADIILSPSPIVQDQSYWKYLHPTYYLS